MRLRISKDGFGSKMVPSYAARHPDRRSHEGLRSPEGAGRPDARGAGRRGAGVPRAERRRQDHDHSAAARPDPPHGRVGRHRRLRLPPAEPRGPASGRLPARGDARLSGIDRRGLSRLSRVARRGGPLARSRRAVAGPVRPWDARPEAEDAGPVTRHAAEIRHRPGADDAPEGSHPGRTHQRPRPADDRGVCPNGCRSEARGADDGVPLVPRAVGSGAHVRPGGRHPRRPPGGSPVGVGNQGFTASPRHRALCGRTGAASA